MIVSALLCRSHLAPVLRRSAAAEATINSPARAVCRMLGRDASGICRHCISFPHLHTNLQPRRLTSSPQATNVVGTANSRVEPRQVCSSKHTLASRSLHRRSFDAARCAATAVSDPPAVEPQPRSTSLPKFVRRTSIKDVKVLLLAVHSLLVFLSPVLTINTNWQNTQQCCTRAAQTRGSVT